MQVKSIIKVYLFFVGFLFVSCKKEFTPIPGLPPAVNTTDSNFISKIYVVKANAGVVDTIHTLTYNYDNLKRVTTYSDSIKDRPNTGLNLYRYFYTGSDILPGKREFFSSASLGARKDTIITFYTYNSSMRRIKDSTLQYLHNNGTYTIVKVMHSFEYTGTKIIGNQNNQVIYASTGGLQNYTEKDTATTDAAGNIIANKKIVSYPGLFQYNTISAFTYDDKFSPFNKINIGKTLPIFPNGETSFGDMSEKNNRLKTHEVISIPSTPDIVYDEDYTGKYTYLASGFPKFLLKVDPATPSKYVKIIFVYKAL